MDAVGMHIRKGCLLICTFHYLVPFHTLMHSPERGPHVHVVEPPLAKGRERDGALGALEPR